jgi:hypothetical protein
VGSCKWTNRVMDIGDLNALRQALAAGSQALNPVPEPWFVLFSREGFDAKLQNLAAGVENHVLLFTPDDLFT